LNLIADKWLPARRLSGAAEVIRPGQITDGIAGADPIIAIDWPRPDFRIATLELLIGLLALAFPPRDLRAWVASWHRPPSPDELDAAFAPFAHAFALDGPGPRFLQDMEDLQTDPEPVESLLIEAPGASTRTKNTDLLVKRDRAQSFSRASAAIALFTLQSWAPAGGAGIRTGLRGGGPLVTLVRPERPSLWHLLWANTPHGEPPPMPELPRILPWLAPTITSEGAQTVTPEAQAHPLQAFWGMPRRIRLDFTALEAPRACGLTGAPDAVQVTGWRQRPRGANYAAWGKVHPLSPHYQVKAGAEWLPVHPQPGGIGYRHWLGLVVEDGQRAPASAVATWRRERRRDALEGVQARLLAAGYDMDNMKARAFVECEMPLPGAAAEDQDRLDALAGALVRAADIAAGLLRNAVRNALFSPGAKVKLDAEGLASLRERLWARTEQPFFDALRSAADGPGAEAGSEAERAAWARLLHRRAMALFDEAAPLDPEAGSAAPRIADARRALNFALLGFGKMGRTFFGTLSLAEPDGRKDAA
jgi:CRISPR system Cascade subunit CasA